MRAEWHTLQAIADAVNTSVKTAQRVTESTLSNDKVVGSDGKARPAKYKPRSSHHEQEGAVFTDKTVGKMRDELCTVHSCDTRIGKPETT